MFEKKEYEEEEEKEKKEGREEEKNGGDEKEKKREIVFDNCFRIISSFFSLCFRPSKRFKLHLFETQCKHHSINQL